MGTFVETAIVDYRLSFADREKTNFFFLFSICSIKRKFAIATNKRKLPFSISSIYCTFLYLRKMELQTYIYICFYFKRKTEAQAFFLLSSYCTYAHCANESGLSVCWQSNKPMLSIFKQNKWTKRAGPSMVFSHITSIRQEIQLQNCLDRVNDTT